MNFPDLPENIFQPLLESVDHVSRLAFDALKRVTDPEQREVFQSLLSELQTKRTEFTTIAIPEILENQRKLQAASASLDSTLAGSTDIISQASLLEQKIADQIVSLNEKMASAKPMDPPARPRTDLFKPKMKAAPLLDGNTLRAFLLGLHDPAVDALLGPHTTGNIWDNWKPGDTGGKPRA